MSNLNPEIRHGRISRINIFRDPRWGRGQETYGEDPYLTGRMAVAFIQGLQGNGRYRKVDATIKHYAVHSGPEDQRHGFNAEVTQKDLYETYLWAFKYCIDNADPSAVMGAYNSVMVIFAVPVRKCSGKFSARIAFRWLCCIRLRCNL